MRGKAAVHSTGTHTTIRSGSSSGSSSAAANSSTSATALAHTRTAQPLYPFALDVGDGRLRGLLCNPYSQRCQPASALVISGTSGASSRVLAYIHNRSRHNASLAHHELPRPWRRLLHLPPTTWASDDR